MDKLENQEFVSMAFDYLYPGLVVPDSIYNFNGKVMLLRKDEILDEHKIMRLKKFNAGKQNVKVSISTFEEIVNNRDLKGVLTPKHLEQQTGYTNFRTSVHSILAQSAASGQIQQAQVDHIKTDIFNKINDEEANSILQCINTPRPMDEDLERHCLNVSIINGFMGKWLKLSDAEINELVLAGLVHDIGKTKIPENILNAPRKLTDEEFQIVKSHTEHSYKLLLADESFSEEVRVAARYHHEKNDGTGYPDGIFGDEIPLFAKITAISDIYDAMVSKRSYKEENTPFKILSMFSQNFFKHLDANLMTLFLNKMPLQFIGKSVLLSDGTLATIRYIMFNDIEYPIVDLDGKVFQTDENLYCIKIVND